MSKPDSITHVLYHANCADGFGAALAAWKVLGSRAEYVPVRHGDEPPELPADAHVAIVDFSYLREALLAVKDKVASLIVLDHHKSASDQMDGLDFAHFDMAKSGARMAWEFWHPGQELPELLAYVEDRDLWRWALPESREVSMALHCYPSDFDVWSSLSMDDLRTEGRAIMRFQTQLLSRAVSRARLTKLGEHEIPVVNSCLFQSELGDELCKLYPDAPFAGVYYVTKEGREAWSLRSIGEFDVAEVAKPFGGGGHRNAAGFARDAPGVAPC